MALYYYYAMLTISMIFVVVYAFIFNKRFDVNLSLITVMVPIINLAFVQMATADTIDEALTALKITYIGGCFLLPLAMFLIFNTCKIKISKVIRTIIIFVSMLVFATTITIGKSDIFYKTIPTLAEAYGAKYITNKHYGFMHTVFYVMVAIEYLITIGGIIYSYFKKREVPRRILTLIVLSVTTAIIGFFGGRLITNSIELLPFTYNLGMIIYIIIASRLRLYDASDSVTESLVQRGETGFISIDYKLRYLASNETAKTFFPELNELIVDKRMDNDTLNNLLFNPLIDRFDKNETDNRSFIEHNNRIYLVSINKLNVSRFYKGYQFLIIDDTSNQEYIKLIKNYNIELEKEVNNKTAHIQDIQNKLVLGLATMVESRDNSTGGHIKRTSDGVRIILDQMKAANDPNVTDEFYINLIRSAPMHDLGKITIDDNVLRKPGKYEPFEYEIMKTHAASGAKIVKEILEGIENKEFVNMAINVAHYHHERWDGSGYPEKLKGEEIPLEARIMAIADVYDALVSKRVYKEKMSFEAANQIILEGMGKQFDPSLEKYYLSAKPYLEEYYSKIS